MLTQYCVLTRKRTKKTHLNIIEASKKDQDHEHKVIDYRAHYIYTYKNGEIIDWKKFAEAIDEKMKSALSTLNAPENKSELWAIKHGYDYAFIKYALEQLLVNGCEKLSKLSTPKFVKYIFVLGFTNFCGDKTLNKYLEDISNEYPHCKFPNVNYLESKRRNAIIQKFVELMN